MGPTEAPAPTTTTAATVGYGPEIDIDIDIDLGNLENPIDDIDLGRYTLDIDIDRVGHVIPFSIPFVNGKLNVCRQAQQITVRF